MRWQDKLVTSLRKTASEPSARFIQFATVDERGIPHNRTVVMRQFDANRSAIEFVTDSRSKKCHHLKHQKKSSICWYLADTREQYRMVGQAEVITLKTDNRKVKAQWKELSDNTQKQFLIDRPGRPLTHPSDLTPLSSCSPPVNFVVVSLIVDNVDYLDISQYPHLRQTYFRDTDNNWQMARINP